jgi:hypothetical protein
MRLPQREPLLIFWLLLFVPIVAGCSKGGSQPDAEERLRRLDRQVEEQRLLSDKAVDAYVPLLAGQLDELNISAVDLLRQLPGVAAVDVLVSATKPTHRLVHLRDWHYVPRDLYALDVQQAIGRRPTELEIDPFHRERLLEVELVQLEQAALLRCLVKHHGLRRVLLEGLTPNGSTAYHEVLSALRSTDVRLATLQEQQATVRGQSPALDREVDALLREHRLQLLPYGAAGRLAMAGAIEVGPLDDEELLDQTNPVRSDGQLRHDPATLEARHDGQVRRALASGPCCLLILGGAHDLSASMRRLANGTAEYIRITTKQYKELVGRK